MKAINKTKLATAISAAALAGAVSAPANAVVLGGDNGWEVSYTGFVNLFYNQGDYDLAAGAGSHDSSHLQEGLLPSFHTMKAVSPEVGGLRGTSQITFAVDTSAAKNTRLNKGGAMIDMREVFFNVEGSFGTISVGRTLSLFQRQAILKDMTLFGMGAVGPDVGGTGLGRIGFGYVYPDFRTRFVWKSPDMNGFNIEAGIFDPQEPAGGTSFSFETDTPQFQTEATYNTTFQGGTLGLWAGALWQEMESTTPGLGDVESFGYNVGIDVGFGGFNVVAHYYDGEALGSLLFNAGGGNGFVCGATCNEADNDGYYVQGTYTFNGKTKLGISYGESTQDADAANGIGEVGNELFTVGVYHDINSWLKVIAEYNTFNSSQQLGLSGDVFSVGGFMFW